MWILRHRLPTGVDTCGDKTHRRFRARAAAFDKRSTGATGVPGTPAEAAPRPGWLTCFVLPARQLLSASRHRRTVRLLTVPSRPNQDFRAAPTNGRRCAAPTWLTPRSAGLISPRQTSQRLFSPAHISKTPRSPARHSPGPTFPDLSGAYLIGADLSGVELTGADLSGAVLTDVDLSAADLTAANLTGATVRADVD